jgi:hypothetical protein
MADLVPYATAKPLFGVLESWLPAEDANRLAAYQLYEGIYRNVPDAFKIIQRGTDANPIYVPSAKTIVEAKNRYLAKRWNFTLDPKMGQDSERQLLASMMTTLFQREMMYSKFATQKRYGLIRGDAVWHIVADPQKPAGKRISIYEIDPAAYFPIEDPYNSDKILGCHLATPVVQIKADGTTGATTIKRQTYRKLDTGQISYELSWWQVAAWDDREGSGQTLKKASPADIPLGPENKAVTMVLPSQITAIPVYHIKNSRIPGASFGTSELEGFERIIGGINQAISDEELALALEGLGLYATTSGPPVDDDGTETTWKIGPGWVVEIDAAADFKRVNGVSSVAPMLEHVGYLEKAMREASGVPDIAIGNVDVSTAESGIALAFKMAPILAGNEEKEQEILSVMDHMLYDLAAMWFPAYEALPASLAQAVSIVDDPMPVNREAIIKEIQALLGTVPPLITAEYARQLLSEKLGYDFPDEMGTAVVTESAAFAESVNVDPFAARVTNELALLQGGVA